MSEYNFTAEFDEQEQSFSIDFADFIALYRGVERVWIGGVENPDHTITPGQTGFLYAEMIDGVIQEVGPVSGYKYALDAGFTGTFVEWVQLILDGTVNAQAAANSAAAALASQNAAAQSETNAATSESSASTYASSAANSANNASGSASSASASATNAASSASSASNSAQTATQKAQDASVSAANAHTSETNASASETIAREKATIATTKASEALSSATSASESAAAALSSKNDASASASSALSSKNAAENSKTAAAQSEQNASASASAAANSATAASTSATNATSSASSASSSKTAAETAKTDAISAKTAAESAKDLAITAKTNSETAASNSLNYSRDSEAWAIGKRNGTDVPSTDATYENNAKYYSGLAYNYMNNIINVVPSTSYQNSTSGTTIPTGAWSSSPNPVKGQYTWAKTEMTWGTLIVSVIYAVSYNGLDGTGANVLSVNGKTGNVVLYGTDIAMTNTDSTSLNTAIDAKAPINNPSFTNGISVSGNVSISNGSISVGNNTLTEAQFAKLISFLNVVDIN